MWGPDGVNKRQRQESQNYIQAFLRAARGHHGKPIEAKNIA